MRCSSSSKKSIRLSTEVEMHKHKEEPHLSLLPTSSDALVMNGENSHPQSPSDGLTEAHKLSRPSHPPRPPKKQVRRRLHTSRPYQERLLNMAEARREIVAALKFHRAAMKQASKEQKQQKQQNQQPPPQVTASILEDSHYTLQMDSLKIPSNIYQTNLTATSCTQQSSLFPLSYPSPSWNYPEFTTFPIFDKFSLFPLPSQPLGLNLNLQSFTDIETPYFSNTIDPHTHQPPPTPSPSPSPSSSSSSYSHMSPAAMAGGATPEVSSKAEKLYPSDPLLHPAMSDEEMAEIRSISEKHGMDWNDAVNLATSAWWSKFLKNMDVEGGENRRGEAIQVFSEVADAPAWLSVESEMDGYLLDCNMDDHQQDVTQPSFEKADKSDGAISNG